MQIAIQLKTVHISSTHLNGAKAIAFNQINDVAHVSEATINQAQLDAIVGALEKLPYKIKRASLDGKWVDAFDAYNGADW